MRSSLHLPPVPMDSIVINELSSQKPTTTLLHSSNIKTPHHHHLYNYWTLNERLRSRNEKLSKRQQSSCRLAFYSLSLFVCTGVMTILIYRFTDDCPLTIIDREQIILRCLRHILFLATICISFLACSGVIFGACRYFRSQPKPFLYNDEYELRLTQNYDILPTTSASHSCYCQTPLANGTCVSPSKQIFNHNDEHSNATMSSSIQNISPQRRVPPFTYDELPPTRSMSPPPLPPLPILLNVNVNSKATNTNRHKSAFFSSSTSASSSPQSIFSAMILSNNPNASTSNNNKRKSTLIFEDACPSTPTSYTTCVCATDVWERQQRPSISLSPR
jgi:hypothetical protein